MTDQPSYEMQLLCAAHLHAARRAFADVPDEDFAAIQEPVMVSSRIRTVESTFQPSSKALGFMHLALSRPYISTDGRPPPPEFFNPKKFLARARFLKGYNPDEPRDDRGRWTGDRNNEVDATDLFGDDDIPLIINSNPRNLESAGRAVISSGFTDTNSSKANPDIFTRPAGVPDDWIQKPTEQPGGVQFTDPNNSGNYVRIMPGNPSSQYPNSRQPYVRWQLNGQALDVEGNMLPTAKTPESHIPIEDFEFFPELFDF